MQGTEMRSLANQLPIKYPQVVPIPSPMQMKMALFRATEKEKRFAKGMNELIGNYPLTLILEDRRQLIDDERLIGELFELDFAPGEAP